MNSALNQELTNPSLFNLSAAIALVVLIILCLCVIGVKFIYKDKEKGVQEEPSKISGKGF